MATNETMRKAKGAKKDEFKTLYNDIRDELVNYKEHFKGKTVWCPCDLRDVSEFCNFLEDVKDEWGIKKLIFTSYPSGECRIIDNNGCHDFTIDGECSYDSDEVKQFRDEADIIVTNPPFSLFKEFIIWLVDSGKKFCVLGRGESIFVKEIFEMYKKNLIWYGKIRNVGMMFQVPDDYESYKIIDGKKICKVTCSWWTNIGNGQEKEHSFDTGIQYNPDNYRKYDNFDAIHVKSRNDIPMNYYGLIGAPSSYLDFRDDDTFEIIGLLNHYKETNVEKGWFIGEERWIKKGNKMVISKGPVLDGKAMFGRILIKRKV